MLYVLRILYIILYSLLSLAHPIDSSPEYLVRQDSAAAAASSPLDEEQDSSQLPAPVIPIRTPPGTPEPTEQPEQQLELKPTHFLEYRLLAGWFEENQQLPKLICNSVLITLYIFLVIQLFATAKVAHLLHGRPSYPSTCNHSGLIFMVTVSLRYMTRFVFPLVLTLQFHYVLGRLNLAADKGRRFLEELQKDKNFTVLQKIALILFNIQVDTSQPMAVHKKKILQRAREDFADDLHAMCLSSLFEGFLLTLAVIGLGAVHYPSVIYPNKIGLSLLGYFDVISCLVLTIFCTLMLAFCFLELKLKYTITAMLEAENLVTADFDIDATQPTVKLTDSLKGEAEKIVNCLALNWCAVDIFMHLGTGLYSILLITSATSGLALSCGVEVKSYQLESDAQIQWLWFVIIALFAHLLATSVFVIPLVRPVGITLEILGVLIIFCMYEERAAYSQYLQILYAIFPACYCFWYHFAIIVYEFLFTYRCKNHKHAHVKKMVYSIGLILLLVVAVLASVYTEYTSLAPDCKEREGTMSGSFFMSSLARSCPSGKGSFQEMCTCSKGQVCACLSYFSLSVKG